jgi:hypothetical protein
VLGQAPIKKEIRIAWQKQPLKNAQNETVNCFYFDDAEYDYSITQPLPIWSKTIPMHDKNIDIEIILLDVVCETIASEDAALIGNHAIDDDFSLEHAIHLSRGNPLLQVKLLPFRKKGENTERLISCMMEITYKNKKSCGEKNNLFATSSLLASGNWYKLRLNKSGIFKITYANLTSMGINPSEINPKNIRIFGYGGGVLPEANNALKYDDLVENPIVVYGEEDGKFDSNDYILFYNQGPITWSYNTSGYFECVNNAYDNYSYVFLTTDLGVGARIETVEAASGNATTFDYFLDRKIYEVDTYNIINMGREWYGDLFDITLNRNYSFEFQNILTSRQARVIINLASRNFSSASFGLSIDGVLKRTIAMGTVSALSHDQASIKTENFLFDASSNAINVGLRYTRAATSSTGWLNYININAWCSLTFNNSQLSFRNPDAIGKISKFIIANANSNMQVWDVTEPTLPRKTKTTLLGNSLSFTSYKNTIQEFIAFDGSQAHNVEFVEKVNNQNLHGIRDIDYLIVTHPRFMEQAERLANLRKERDGFTTYITTPDLIYNEFSSGGKDISAIRNFVRMLYKESSTGRELRYLVLFGDASFDSKNRSGEVDLVPTFETQYSLSITTSFPADDYYGLLDEDEGGNINAGFLDIGIGRFPVNTVEEASNMIDKIENYLKNDEETMKPWRNIVTLVADDNEVNQNFTGDLERLEVVINEFEPAINIDKIYLDAYPQIATSGGKRAPEVNDAINKRISKGTLVVNYIGHGGEIGWTQERILQISDINSWRNGDKLPLFITGTCEFSRFDDHTRTSAGELVFLNPHGGAIAMFTTTRATYAGSNFVINKAVYDDNLFSFQNGEYARLSDVLRKSKLNNGEHRKFILFGDPALQLTYPQLNIVTTKINGQQVGGFLRDTLKALKPVSIEGYVADYEGNIINDYNGVIYTTVYDKEKEITTFGDEPDTDPITFKLRNSILFNGKTSVTDGRFEVSFTMPKDISYNYGKGHISYYATNYKHDANGFYEDIFIGGFYENAFEDENGPAIRLFIDDTLFVNGSITNENPLMLAFVSDESGINTTGAGIGHNITAKLSGATTASYILNDYFEGELNDSRNGTITYPFLNLNTGHHVLTLKVWDIYNNSSEASISFEVVNSSNSAVRNLHNYPNPFSDETYFVFDHNQIGNNMTVEIQLFDMDGQHVHTIKQNMYGTSTRSNPIRWDGTTRNGKTLANGLYIYRLLLTNEYGETTDKRSKLLYIR